MGGRPSSESRGGSQSELLDESPDELSGLESDLPLGEDEEDDEDEDEEDDESELEDLDFLP